MPGERSPTFAIPLYQSLQSNPLWRLARVGAIDQNHIIDSRVGSELRQHFLFGVEVVMNNLNARAFLKHF